MPTPIQAQLLASFGAGGGDSINLLIEPDPNRASVEIVPLLLFPAVGANLAASAGTVRLGNTKTVDVPGGIITFSGGASAQLAKIPFDNNPTFDVLFAFDTNGSPAGIGVQLDSATGTVRASAECFAAVAYTAYKTRAIEIDYTPQTDNLGSGVSVTFGVIAAYYPPRSITIYEVQPFGVDDGNVEVEVYRIYSHTVSNNDGQFEFPPQWPANGSYPDAALVLDTNQGAQFERVHEIGYMDQRGRAWVRALYAQNLEPYVGNSGYKPTKHCRVSTIPPDLFSKELIAKATNWVKQRGYGCKGSSGA